MRTQFILLAAVLGVAPMLCAQHAAKPPIPIKATAKGEIPAGPAITDSAMCDDAGNVYSRPFGPNSVSEYLRAPIVEITAEAKPVGSFPSEGHTFFVRGDRVYALAGPPRVYLWWSSPRTAR